MTTRDVLGFVREVLWQPFSGVLVILTGLASLLTWFGIGEHWPSGIKVLVAVVLPLLILLIYVLYVAYLLHMKVDRPLRVRKVSPGTHYFVGRVMVILERRDTVAVDDILTLFVREGDAEVPICLISVETITSKGFPQSVVLRPPTDVSLLNYLIDETRIEQLQAKRGVTRRHLECLMTQ